MHQYNQLDYMILAHKQSSKRIEMWGKLLSEVRQVLQPGEVLVFVKMYCLSQALPD